MYGVIHALPGLHPDQVVRLQVKLPASGARLIMASDGVWDAFDSMTRVGVMARPWTNEVPALHAHLPLMHQIISGLMMVPCHRTKLSPIRTCSDVRLIRPQLKLNANCQLAAQGQLASNLPLTCCSRLPFPS